MDALTHRDTPCICHPRAGGYNPPASSQRAVRAFAEVHEFALDERWIPPWNTNPGAVMRGSLRAKRPRTVGALLAALLGALTAAWLLGAEQLQPETDPGSTPAAAPPRPPGSRPALAPAGSPRTPPPGDVAPQPAAEPEAFEIRCPIAADDIEDTQLFLSFDGGHLVVTARIEAGQLSFTSPRQVALGHLQLPQSHSVEVYVLPSGEGARCEVPKPPVPLTLIQGRIDSPVPDDGAPLLVRGCDNIALAEPDGSYQLIVPEPIQPCELAAERMDGAIKVLGDLVEVQPRRGQTLRVDLQLPEEPFGGIGVSFLPAGDFVLVRQVHEDTPAAAAGMQAGDRILEVQGEPTAAMESEDFIWLGVGPVGTPVDLLVEHPDGEIEELRIVRAHIPDPW